MSDETSAAVVKALAGQYPISWWENTGRMGEWRGAVSAPVMRNLKTGAEVDQRDLPVGACYAAQRDPSRGPNGWPPTGADGLSIVCTLPGGDHWYIDSRCNNCTLPADRVHRCWIRHGTVGDALTVDKNGRTCSAGAGSISVPGWHGFLRGGRLVPA